MTAKQIETQSERTIRHFVQQGSIDFNRAATLRLCYELIVSERSVSWKGRVLIAICLLASIAFIADGDTISLVAAWVCLTMAVWVAITAYKLTRETDALFIEKLGVTRKQLMDWIR